MVLIQNEVQSGQYNDISPNKYIVGYNTVKISYGTQHRIVPRGGWDWCEAVQSGPRQTWLTALTNSLNIVPLVNFFDHKDDGLVTSNL